MRLPQPFLRLPLRFDAARLRAEVAGFGPADWRPHPQGHPGNWALPLVSLNGDPTDDGVAGPMRPTPHLERSPYLRQVLAALAAPLGRTRLMKLDARAEATAHVNTNYYWRERVRVHVPVVTYAEVEFVCDRTSTRMAEGECWIFDTWRMHNVLNPTPHERVHLVVDTVGSDAFWAFAGARSAERRVDFVPGVDPELRFESSNFPVVMSPWELEGLWRDWIGEARLADADAGAIDAIDAAVRRVLRDWRALWAEHGERPIAWPRYAGLIERLRDQARAFTGRIRLPNQMDLAGLIEDSLAPAMHTPSLAPAVPTAAHVPGPAPRPAVAAARRPTPRFDRPIVIAAAPRSGSSMLFEALARSPGVYTVGGESHREIESIAALRPDARGYDSNRLTAADATLAIADEVRARFAAALRDRDARRPDAAAPSVRLLEKTPKNALRLPFLDAVFPDACVVYLYRDPAESLASLIDGWTSGRFVTYPDLPGWTGPPWSYLLVPGWRELIGAPLAAIVAAQWQRTQQALLDDLAALPKERVVAFDYRDLVADPRRAIEAIGAFAGITVDRELPASLPLSAHTLTPPDPDKWRRHEAEIAPHLEALAPLAERARAFVERRRARPVAAGPVPPPLAPADAAALTSAAASAAAPPPFSSVHTTNLPEILRELEVSLAISTFQAGHLILARDDGASVNTHFVPQRKPMGLAADRDRLIVGTETGLREFRNVPAVAARLDPPGRHDAVYVLRNHHVTAAIDVHDLALGGGECWYVNTLFSCLCTLDPDLSFVPRWRPRFVTSLAPEDRCHLNGLAMVEGRPAFLTALGSTDTPEGWRANKKNGGVLLDYASRETIAAGLSMPHSPRWYRGRLWLLESGRGSLATVDLATGTVETVAQLPGFTRGLDFAGPLAFVGLSQLRASNPFTDIPITDDNAERASGVWVVHIETGETVAFLKFSASVEEIFTVQVLAGVRRPAIVDEEDDAIKATYVLPDDALRDVRFTTPSADRTAPEHAPG
ncbi:MAG: TIGR03032 family protein [Burkholderiales bacterium]